MWLQRAKNRRRCSRTNRFELAKIKVRLADPVPRIVLLVGQVLERRTVCVVVGLDLWAVGAPLRGRLGMPPNTHRGSGPRIEAGGPADLGLSGRRHQRQNQTRHPQSHRLHSLDPAPGLSLIALLYSVWPGSKSGKRLWAYLYNIASFCRKLAPAVALSADPMAAETGSDSAGRRHDPPSTRPVADGEVLRRLSH